MTVAACNGQDFRCSLTSVTHGLFWYQWHDLRFCFTNICCCEISFEQCSLWYLFVFTCPVVHLAVTMHSRAIKLSAAKCDHWNNLDWKLCTNVSDKLLSSFASGQLNRNVHQWYAVTESLISSGSCKESWLTEYIHDYHESQFRCNCCCCTRTDNPLTDSWSSPKVMDARYTSPGNESTWSFPWSFRRNSCSHFWKRSSYWRRPFAAKGADDSHASHSHHCSHPCQTPCLQRSLQGFVSRLSSSMWQCASCTSEYLYSDGPAVLNLIILHSSPTANNSLCMLWARVVVPQEASGGLQIPARGTKRNAADLLILKIHWVAPG